jgi:hypothetical protein
MGLRSWFKRTFVGFSFDEIRQMHIARAAKLSRAEAIASLERDARLTHPAASEHRRELLALVAAGPLDPAERARCQELMMSALQAQGFLFRPETADEVWWLEGLLDRLSREDGHGE